MKKKNTETRLHLIESGVKLFGERGYHGTGIKEIVDSQGVPKGSFYNYFESKENFTSEIVKHYGEMLERLWKACEEAGPEDNPLQMLQNAFEHMIYLQESNEVRIGCLIGNLAGELAESSEMCRISLNQVKESWCGRISFHLARAQELGTVRKDLSSDELAGFCWDVWEGALLRMKIEKSTESIGKTIKMLFEVFFKL